MFSQGLPPDQNMSHHLDPNSPLLRDLSRRRFLAASSAFLALPAFSPRHRPAPCRFADDPFGLGAASGDPSSDGVVLWTRLATAPLDGDGGMPNEVVEVAWEIAHDDGMRRVVAHGTALALPQLGHSVHVEVEGLQPDRWYWYRFRAGDAPSPIGRTRTLPPAHAMPERLRFAFASCQHFEAGHYTAYAHMAAQDLDLVFHLGDYIYEGKGRNGQVRKHQGGKLITLSDYRVRYAQYRTDPLLRQMHARCPWFVTFDDHEFENNYANDISERQDMDPVRFLEQRVDAYQAYYEAMPLRRSALPHGPDMQLYRKASFGRLAELFVLDTRQYRTDQPNGDGRRELDGAALDEHNTLLGSTQRGWLMAGLAASPARWNVLAQQIMMGMVGHPPKVGDGLRYAMDQWPGYAHERGRLLQFLQDRRVANPIVLTGDIHAHFVNDLRVDDQQGDQPIVATEFVGSSISSGGNGHDAAAEMAKLQPLNPGLRFLNRQRGYVACTLTRTECTADYFVADQVTAPGGRVDKIATFVVAAGVPGVQEARSGLLAPTPR